MGQVTEPYTGQEEKETEEVYEGRAIAETEGKNVDKLVANRIKKRGRGWMIKGAPRMTRLINLREMGKLHCWIAHKDKRMDNQPPKKESSKKNQSWG